MITIILTLLILILTYSTINLYRKNDLLLKELESLNELEQNSLSLINNLVITYSRVLTRLVRIDRNGSFESDDEVGFVFKTIKNTIEELKVELINLQKQLTETQEK